MAIPRFPQFFLPLLELASDGEEHSMDDARAHLAAAFQLTAEDLAEVLPSGRQRRFINRVAWAKVHLAHAGLVATPREGVFLITERGRQLLAERPTQLTFNDLDRFEEHRLFRKGNRQAKTAEAAPPAESVGETPEERLEQAYQALKDEVLGLVLLRVKEASPEFFEKLVVELLLKMGYGRSRAEAGKAIGRAGDEGIDGVISEDRLGLENLYIQAKRWAGTVGRPEIQRFVGALHGRKARKGVFLTTGAFSAEARDYALNIETRVVLIDGAELAEYMFDLGLGVTLKASYEVKRLDSDYFVEE